MNQSRNRVQYDLNDCREILNSTIFEYQLVNDNSCIVNDTTIPQITIISPLNRVYTTRNISFVLFSNEELSGCTFSLTSLSSGNTEENRMTLSGDKKRAEKNITQLINGDYHVLFNCSDIQRNVNDSEFADFSVNSSSIQPRIELTILSPLSNIEVDRNSIFNVTLKVKCLESDCGNIRVSLDPEQKVSGWGRIAGWLKNLFGFNKKKIYLSPSPKGLVSSATGALPFYTNETNPRLINLRKDESEEVAFFVNATGLSAIYEFFAYANLTDNENINNFSSRWNVTIAGNTTEMPFELSLISPVSGTKLTSLDLSISSNKLLSSCVLNFDNSRLNNTISIDGQNHLSYRNNSLRLGKHRAKIWCNDSSNVFNNLSFSFVIYKKLANFDGNTTQFEDFDNDFYNLIFEKKGKGKISFNRGINASRFRENPEIIDLAVNVSSHKIGINTETLPEFINLSASIVFTEVNYTNPIVLYNGVICPADKCLGSLYDKSGNIFYLNVSGFSEFSIIEGSYCGDHKCDDGETCRTCSDDCGGCPAPSGGGSYTGSGGGDTVKTCTPSWNCSWTVCLDNKQKYNCVDLKKCNSTLNKPLETIVNCTVMGSSAGDNTQIINNEETSENYFEKLYSLFSDLKDNFSTNDYFIIFISAFAIILLIIILFILSKRNKAHLLVKKDAKENTQDKSDYEIKIKSAKEFVDKYRKAGYRDAVTRQLFLEKGWNQKDLDRIF
jgi:hypothetical protein